MEQAAGSTGILPRQSFNDASKSHADLKDNFYRYFQQEVAGKLPTSRRVMQADASCRSPRPD
jgi:hypothetical protein